MAGQIKKMLDQIIETRSRGDSFLALTTKTKLVLKGINPDKYDCDSPDNPWVIKDVRRIAKAAVFENNLAGKGQFSSGLQCWPAIATIQPLGGKISFREGECEESV